MKSTLPVADERQESCELPVLKKTFSIDKGETGPISPASPFSPQRHQFAVKMEGGSAFTKQHASAEEAALSHQRIVENCKKHRRETYLAREVSPLL